MTKICFELKDIYFLVVVLIGLFIFSSYIIRNPLTCPQKVCPKCNIIKIENPVVNEENKIRRNINDQLVPPQRLYSLTRRSMPPPVEQGIPINTPTRGETPIFQKIGVLTKNNSEEDPDNARLPLYGRPKYPGSNDYDYYVMDGSRNANKIGLDIKKRQLDNNDELTIPGFNGSYKVSLYVYDAPRYIPF